MATRQIVTNQAAVVCDVCGRTLLRGENADVFLAGGARRRVCELCTPRAAHEGWIREGIDEDALRAGPRDRHGRGSFLQRLRGRRDAHRAREAFAYELPPDGVVDHPAYGGYDDALEPIDVAHAEPAPPVAAPPPEPVAPTPPPPVAMPDLPREPRQVRAVPTNADMKRARAVDVFNASRHPRTVAALARSLGAPFVVVRPSETEGSIVTVTVGWELCWYRYEIDLADEGAGVRQTAQGDELDELDPPDRVPNAAALETGELRLAAASE